jgi:hypothetical protein
MNTTELAQHIVRQSDGTTLDEIQSRSRMLSKSLRKIRMLERQLEQDGDTTPIQQQWVRLRRKVDIAVNKSYNWAASADRIESELAELPLCETPDRPEYQQGGKWNEVYHSPHYIQWMHECKLHMPDGSVEDMGTFFVRVNTDRRSMGSGINVYPHKRCYEFHSSHPHVGSGQHLCTGEADRMIASLRKSHDWATLYDIVCATLDTFNPDSPFWRVDRMFQEMKRCKRCGHDPEYYRSPARQMHMDPDYRTGSPYRPRLVCSECIEAERRAAFRNALRDAARGHHTEIARRRYDNP